MNEADFGLANTRSGKKLVLRGVDASARISGLLAETRLTQRYRNETRVNLELTYTFPLPVAGVLLSFSVTIGERHYHGEVIPRRQAEVDYEKAIGKGDSAFRLQEVQAGIYSATLGNVMAGEAVEICLSYAETLNWNGKSLRYRLPTTLAPRYGEPKGMQPWQRPETNLMAEYPLSLKVSIAGALAKSAISCPSHKISIKAEQDELTIHLASGASMDRDFILEIKNEEVSSVGVFARARDTNIAMLTLLPPEQEKVSDHRGVILVIDCSGSMQGDSLRLAKEGIMLALGSLAPDDYFGLIAFGTEFRHFDPEFQPANRKNLDLARRWLKNLGDLGGTEINSALELALKLPGRKKRDILLLTDGQDWQIGSAIRKAKILGVRIFSMGIGSAVAEDSVHRMADETGGACELIAPTEDMSERIYRHFNRMRQPQMSHLEIAWPTQALWEQKPERACFAGDAYTVFAALPVDAVDAVMVTFGFADQENQSIRVPIFVETTTDDAIVRVAASARLPALPDDAQMDWAVNYQLITKQTDYLITVERNADEKATEFPELQTQPQMLPAGWGGSSSVAEPAYVRRARHSERDIPAYYRLPKDYSRKNAPDCCSIEDDLPFGGDAPAFTASVTACYDIPACMHKTQMPEKKLADNGYQKLFRQLQALGNKLGGRLPDSFSGLRTTFSFPKTLAALLDSLRENHSEQELVSAFYQALLAHDGQTRFNSRFVRKVNTIIGETLINQDLVDAIHHCLNDLYQPDQSGADRFEIPKWLRQQAD